MNRRAFITLLGGAATVWPLPARSQQPAMPVIGFLRSTSLAEATHLVTAFREGLKETGFVEGQNVAIEFRSAEDQLDRLPALATELIRRPVGVIVSNHNSTFAAKAATTTVPIVFATGSGTIRAGKTGKIKLKLTKAGLASLIRTGKLTVVVVATVTRGPTVTKVTNRVVFKAAKHRH